MYVIRDNVQAYVSDIILYFSQNKIMNCCVFCHRCPLQRGERVQTYSSQLLMSNFKRRVLCVNGLSCLICNNNIISIFGLSIARAFVHIVRHVLFYCNFDQLFEALVSKRAFFPKYLENLTNPKLLNGKESTWHVTKYGVPYSEFVLCI